jgi:hypothetical protein
MIVFRHFDPYSVEYSTSSRSEAGNHFISMSRTTIPAASICGTAHNIASPEMLYISGSSGAQFDERAATLRGSDEVISAIEAAISQEDIPS